MYVCSAWMYDCQHDNLKTVRATATKFLHMVPLDKYWSGVVFGVKKLKVKVTGNVCMYVCMYVRMITRKP